MSSISSMRVIFVKTGRPVIGPLNEIVAMMGTYICLSNYIRMKPEMSRNARTMCNTALKWTIPLSLSLSSENVVGGKREKSKCIIDGIRSRRVYVRHDCRSMGWRNDEFLVTLRSFPSSSSSRIVEGRPSVTHVRTTDDSSVHAGALLLQSRRTNGEEGI